MISSGLHRTGQFNFPATVYVPSTGTTFSGGSITTSIASVGTGSSDGLVSLNSTAAAAGAQQYSPVIRLTGYGWKTNATAASQQVDFALQTQPVQGAAAPTSAIHFLSQINAGGYTSVARITSSGLVYCGGVQASGDIDTSGRLYSSSYVQSSGPLYGTSYDATSAVAITIGAATAASVGVGRAAGSVGFFGTTPTTKQTSVEALTNSVTVGGTTGTIADFTNLTVYANDAATIRNDIYQLARKIKQVDDALRLYGLLT